MSRDINDPEIKVNIRTTPTTEEKMETPRLNSNLVSGMMNNFFTSLITGGYTTTYRNGDNDYFQPRAHAGASARTGADAHAARNAPGDVTGYAYLTLSDSFGDSQGFYSDIPYLLQAMTIIEPENFTHKNTNIILDIQSHKCTVSEISKECAVCLEKIKEGDTLTTIDCAHTFHYSCITEWGKYKQECPLCRTPIPILEV